MDQLGKVERPVTTVHPTGPKWEVSARSSGPERLLTRAAGATETTETLGVWTTQSGTVRPTLDVARENGETTSERHAGSQLVATPGVSTKKADVVSVGLIS